MTNKKEIKNALTTPNLVEALRHLRALDAIPNAQFTFQTFLDQKNTDVEAKRTVTRVLHGTLEQHAKELTRLNRLGAGIYVTINETDGRGRTAENVVSIRAVFADKDDGPFTTLPIEPSLVIASKNGDHAYWSMEPNLTPEWFTCAQKSIAHHLATDKVVHDPSRVMRLAGFFHMKDPQDPFLVKIKAQSKAKYTMRDICDAFPTVASVTKKPGKTSKNPKSKTAAQGPDILAGINPVATRNRCLKFLKDWEPAIDGDHGDAHTLQTANRLMDRGVKTPEECRELLEVSGWNDRCTPPWPHTELLEKCRNAWKYRKDDIGKSAPEVLFNTIQGKEKSKDAVGIADEYLISRTLQDHELLRLRFHKNEFYRYQGDRYAKVSRSDLRADLMRFLQCSVQTRKRATITFANNVVANLEGKTLVPETVQMPSFVSQPTKKSSRLIAMKNGILDMNAPGVGYSNSLSPHTPDFFSTSCLPFGYDPEAKCPTWLRFLKKSLPDGELRLFLQEWFGYNLVFDYQHHKFVLFIGEGANGKSVVCTVLRALIGSENVSGVGLEQFDPKRTFPVAAMLGKLANIIEEIGEVDNVAEGVLKDLSTGGVMTVERKNKDPFEMKATARLTFATNVLPRFKDRSSALWRRMMPIPFDVQILNPAEQDKRLVNSDWWESSGELPGVMNWAILGLIRLNEQEQFTMPMVSGKLLKQYQAEANPAATFLEENYSTQPGSSISVTSLYKHYSMWMTNQNNKALGQSRFTREVGKRFPDAGPTENAIRQPDRTRAREWMGIGPIKDKPLSPDEVEDFK